MGGYNVELACAAGRGGEQARARQGQVACSQGGQLQASPGLQRWQLHSCRSGSTPAAGGGGSRLLPCLSSCVQH